MAKYKTLPILRDSRLMMVEVERIVKDFPRYHKYTLGTEIRQTAMKVYKYVSRAIKYKEFRKSYITKLLFVLDDLNLQLQVAKELHVFKSFRQFEIILTHTQQISKQSFSWKKKYD